MEDNQKIDDNLNELVDNLSNDNKNIVINSNKKENEPNIEHDQDQEDVDNEITQSTVFLTKSQLDNGEDDKFTHIEHENNEDRPITVSEYNHVSPIMSKSDLIPINDHFKNDKQQQENEKLIDDSENSQKGEEEEQEEDKLNKSDKQDNDDELEYEIPNFANDSQCLFETCSFNTLKNNILNQIYLF
jgi:PHD/YefM family antitoxin component YafN of YafNO toxin-antitoxin module